MESNPQEKPEEMDAEEKPEEMNAEEKPEEGTEKKEASFCLILVCFYVKFI